jgi:uncharacterized membrane protein YedE/YeeE|uniref:YeeE/YedE family protein n=1 Tax=Stappia sp. TaxID=1870903 RepID=UPI003BAC1EA9
MTTEFTPYLAALGGTLIGVSAVVLMALFGRIAGISGIAASLLPGAALQSGDGERGWRIAFLAGMIAAPMGLLALTGEMPQIAVPASSLALLGGGVLVGIGVTLGSGCTSGHGVCGMARLSMRSITATLTFMATTAATVFVTRHLIGG